MLTGLRSAYQTMIDNLKAKVPGSSEKQFNMARALDEEKALNCLRDKLRDEEIARIERCRLTEEEYAASTLYLDAVSELERMGDYLINISQAMEQAKAL